MTCVDRGGIKKQMKKLFSNLICILLIATFSPAVTSQQNTMIQSTGPNIQQTSMAANWFEIQKLLASDGETTDWFGWSVSLDGDSVVIGASYDDIDRGSAYVFTRSGTIWIQEAKLTASDGEADNWFGWSVCLDNDTVVIGATHDDSIVHDRGSAYVFTCSGTTWTQEAKLITSDGEANDLFGFSVSLEGDTAVIGATHDDSARGSAYIFIRKKIDLTVSIGGGFGIYATIKNNGTTNVSDIPWQIYVEGGILNRISKIVNGTIDIAANWSKTVKTGMLFGFGPITITIKVADNEKTTKGMQLIVFSMVKTCLLERYETKRSSLLKIVNHVDP